jgi:hypothetical protein
VKVYTISQYDIHAVDFSFGAAGRNRTYSPVTRLDLQSSTTLLLCRNSIIGEPCGTRTRNDHLERVVTYSDLSNGPYSVLGYGTSLFNPPWTLNTVISYIPHVLLERTVIMQLR